MSEARTALWETLAAAGAHMGAYRGAATAASFGDVAAEFRLLSASCAAFDLGWRGKLLATGEDRVRWLNGMVTNNVRDLPPNRGVYCFLLSAQGRIQADMTVYNRGDSLLLDTDLSQAEKVRETLDRFIIMDDVELTSAQEKLTAIGLQGPLAGEVLQRAGLPHPDVALELVDTHLGELGVSVVRGASADTPQFELWMAPPHAPAVWQALRQAGAPACGYEAYELWRIAAGLPIYGQDIRDRDLPQETEQQQALNFTKGCYIGQEIVERIRSRGQVHRMFTAFVFADGVAAPAPGSKVKLGEKEIGELTTVARLPLETGDKLVALGYVRREQAPYGTEVEIEGARAVVTAPPIPH